MSKTIDKAEKSPAVQEEAFEMIELAIGDLDTLARAFNLIAEVCEENCAAPSLGEELPPKNLVN